MNKEVLLFTTGIDSYIAYHYLHFNRHNFDCLYFDYGGKYCDNEKKKISELPFPVIIDNRLRLKELEQPSAFIPNRNILFTTIANSLGYDKIWIGGSKSDRVCDNNEGVFNQLSGFLTMMNSHHIKIDSPFWNCYKEDMIKWFIQHRNSTDLVYNTFSCYEPLEIPKEYFFQFGDSKQIPYITNECMMCSACFRKCAALWGGANIYIPFYDMTVAEKYRVEFANALVRDTRANGTLDYINKLYEITYVGG